MKKTFLLLTSLALAAACGSPETDKYVGTIEEIVLRNAPGADKSVYKFKILEMTEMPDITADSLRRLRPLLDLPANMPPKVKVLRTRYQLTEPRSGTLVKERFDFYMAPDGSTCYLKIAARH